MIISNQTFPHSRECENVLNIMKSTLKLIGAIVVCELVGVLGSFFTTPAIPTWYASLIKPSFSPPSWVFAPVWTTLFALMGIAFFLVWQKGFKGVNGKLAFAIFILQLVLNLMWSIIFFGLHNIGLAAMEIAILWVAILVTVIRFYRISKPAGFLLLPYLLWVTFAAILTFAYWQLN